MAWKRTGVAVLLLGGLHGAGTGPGAAQQARKGPEYPLYCAGIVVGMSKDRDVRRMYGDGLFVKSEGHGGGRYFLDPGRTVTLHVEIGVDSGIDAVSYSRGVRLPAGSGNAAARAVSPKLTADERLSLGIRLGETASSVIRQFGKPKKDSRSGASRVIRYETDHESTPYVLFYEAEFRFTNNRLIAVKLYNGE